MDCCRHCGAADKSDSHLAGVAKLADALDLGSSGVPVGVRVPPLALVRGMAFLNDPYPCD